MNKLTLTYTIILALVLLVPGSALATTSSFDRTTVFVVDGFGGVVRDLNLKATQAANGDVIPVSSFEIEPEDVVQVKQGGNFMVFTGSSEDIIEKVKVTSAAGITTELVNVQGNSYSIQFLATGVYTLDIIVDTGDEKAAFETILVVLGPNEVPINPLTIINNFQSIIETKTIIKFNGNDNKDNKTKDDLRKICALNPSDERCPDPKDGDCPKGWGMNEAGECFPLGKCPDGFHRANDDESGRCVPEDNLQQCEDGSWAHEDEQCPEDEEPLPEPPICTPDGPECPPCPIGVEAGWCQDEDERQDEEVEETPPEEEVPGDVEDTPEPEEPIEEEEEETEESGTEEEAGAGVE